MKEYANWKFTNRNMAYNEANIEALEEFMMPDLQDVEDGTQARNVQKSCPTSTIFQS